MAAEYEFKMRVTRADREGYYYTRWDKERATSLKVIAADRDEAFQMAFEVMGECPRGWYWTAKIDGVKAVAKS